MASTNDYYKKNPKAKRKKDAYNKEFNKKAEQRKKRAELVKIRRKAGVYGNRDGKDYDHATGSFVAASVNRGRKEKSRLKKK